MIQNENIQQLIQKYHENKLSHIFLVETDNKENALKDIINFIKVINCLEEYKENCTNCNLCHLIETDSLPSLKIIYPDGQNIKKSQMEELKKDFSCMPYFSKYNTYIINDAEKFNASSANTMLKFIEEPEANIIGFLITNNKENVIETIKSRCEILKANYFSESLNVIDERLKELACQYLQKLEVEKQKGIVYNRLILDEKLEKKELIELFQFILNIYLGAYHDTLEEKFKFLESLSSEKKLMRIKLISEIIERLSYNVNVQLLLDSFVLQLED